MHQNWIQQVEDSKEFLIFYSRDLLFVYNSIGYSGESLNFLGNGVSLCKTK